MKFKGTIIISLISLLERLSYYGVRAILILYVIEVDSFSMDASESINFYGYWATTLVFAAIPFSLLTDKFLGQRNSIYLGGFISLIGYLLLLIQSELVIIISLILIIIGTSLVKPSTTILIGRLFKKENKHRTLAYILFFLGINLGAFLGSLGIGYIGETHSWKFGFAVAALSTLVYISIAYFLRSSITEIETNDLINENTKVNFKRSLIILPILIIIHIVFWKNHELQLIGFIDTVVNSEDKSFFGYEMLTSFYSGLTSMMAFPLTIIVFIYWLRNGVTNFYKSISISMIVLVIAIIASYMVQNVEIKNLIEYSIFPLAFYALAEVIISPIITSYVTRISDVNYSNTIYSTFILVTYGIGIGITELLQNNIHLYLTIISLILTVLGLWVFNKQINKLTYELK